MSDQKIDFLRELSERKDIIYPVVEKYVSLDDPKEQYDLVSEYSKRKGKYFRPCLLLLSAEMFGVDPKDALAAAAAIQITEDAMLIHDDIEDHSDERRHKPTLHRICGEELALNAGDALIAILFRALGDAAEQKGGAAGWKLYRTLVDVVLTTTEGQYMELNWIRNKKIFVTEEEYMEMIRRKTSLYTTVGPLQMGAIIADASDDELANLKKWGTLFGYAFQIWDDYMNIASTTEVQGKENGGDILEGKRTLLLSHLLSQCADEEKQKITKIYLKDRLQKTEEEKYWIIAQMRKYGSDQYAATKAKAYAEEAKKLFQETTAHLPPTKAKEIILAGIDFVVNREA